MFGKKRPIINLQMHFTLKIITKHEFNNFQLSNNKIKLANILFHDKILNLSEHVTMKISLVIFHYTEITIGNNNV